MTSLRNLVQCKLGYTEQYANDQEYRFELDAFGRNVAEIHDQVARAFFLTNSAVYIAVPDVPADAEAKLPQPDVIPAQGKRQKKTEKRSPLLPTVQPYKGYTAEIRYDEGADELVGAVVDGPATIQFTAKTADELQEAFHASVDAYDAAAELQDPANETGDGEQEGGDGSEQEGEGTDDADDEQGDGDDTSASGTADAPGLMLGGAGGEGSADGSAEGTGSSETPSDGSTLHYTADMLNKLTKPEIIALADDLEIVVINRDPKAKIIEQFLAGQG